MNVMNWGLLILKRFNLETRKKLKYFMEQQENLMAIVTLLSIISYAILFCITKNVFVLIGGYAFCYFIYTKIYKHIYNKLFRNDCK